MGMHMQYTSARVHLHYRALTSNCQVICSTLTVWWGKHAGSAGAQHALPGVGGQQLLHSLWGTAGPEQALR